MAISSMAKILIACHKSQVSPLLETLQQSGISQILNAEEAMVSKHYPDLETAGDRPREIEEKLSLTARSVTFLARYADTPKGLAAVLAPRVVIDRNRYDSVTKDDKTDELVTAALDVESKIDKLLSEIENVKGTMSRLRPWAALDVKVEELAELQKTTCFAGLLPGNKLTDVSERLAQAEDAMEQVGSVGTLLAILVVCLKDNTSDVQKLLRSADFESVSFEGMTGTIAEIIEQNNNKLSQLQDELAGQKSQAKELAKDFLKLQILHDHYLNLLNREQMASDCPATERTVILEGWVRKKDFRKLEKLVSGFETAQISEIETTEGEDVPVEIENKGLIKPFEFITRLYGMPHPTSVDPTVFLAPFFAIFFGLCITDAGYGIILAVLLYWLMKKLQAGKAAVFMFFMCSIMTIIAGALTGSWFSDSAQSLIPSGSAMYETINSLRTSIILFDPMSQPKTFFALALAMGYIQIMFALFIGMFNNISKKDYVSAIFDQVSWLVFLNSLALLGAAKGGFIPSSVGSAMVPVAIVLAIVILLSSERQGGWGGRIGMGAFALFGTVFYVGDMLSYVRLMALGMVSAGFGMAINVLVKLCAGVPYAGFILAPLMFIVGHSFNLALSLLSAFVHSLRLQFVEFFPKFLVGGGREFKPLAKKYNYVQVNK